MKQFYKPDVQRRSSCPIDISSEIRKLSMKNKTKIWCEISHKRKNNFMTIHFTLSICDKDLKNPHKHFE